MNIRDVEMQLDELDEDLTIFARRPWTAESEVVLCRGNDDVDQDRATAAGFEYFLEIHIANEVLEPMARQDVEKRLRVLLYYAENDAFPDE